MKTRTYFIIGTILALCVGLSVELESKIAWVIAWGNILILSLVYFISQSNEEAKK